MCYECRVKSYDEENWRLVGEIVNVSLDERILGEDRKVSFEKLDKQISVYRVDLMEKFNILRVM